MLNNKYTPYNRNNKLQRKPELIFQIPEVLNWRTLINWQSLQRPLITWAAASRHPMSLTGFCNEVSGV